MAKKNATSISTEEKSNTRSSPETSPLTYDAMVKILITKLSTLDNVLAWKANDKEDHHIIGLKLVTRTTVEIINPNGFNPFEKKIEEILAKPFLILLDSDANTIKNKESKMYYKDKGIDYITSDDLNYIVNYIINFK